MGHEIIWLGPFPEVRTKNLLNWNSNSLYYYAQFNRLAKNISKGFNEVHFVEFGKVFSLDDIEKSPRIDGCLIYQDANHLSDCGEKFFGENAAAFMDVFSFNAQ